MAFPGEPTIVVARLVASLLTAGSRGRGAIPGRGSEPRCRVLQSGKIMEIVFNNGAVEKVR